jgi:hypothetical protein
MPRTEAAIQQQAAAAVGRRSINFAQSSTQVPGIGFVAIETIALNRGTTS